MKKFALLLFTALMLIQPIIPILTQESDPVVQCVKGVELFLDGKTDEALPLLEDGFAERENISFPDPNDLGRCALALGQLRDARSDWSGALEAFSVALETFSQTGERWFEGTTLRHISVVYYSQGRYEEALARNWDALAITREMGDWAGEVTTLNNIALIFKSQGQYEEVFAIYEEALAIHHYVGDRDGEAATLNNIGLVYQLQGRYEEALTWFEKGLSIRREVGDRAGEGTTLNNIAGVYQLQGRYEEALTWFEEALAIAREFDDRADEGEILNNIAGVYQLQGRYEEALAWFEETLAIAREFDDRTGEGGSLNNIALIYHLQGQYEEALTLYKESLSIRREVGDRAGEGNSLNNIAGVYLLQGRYKEAFTWFEGALAIRREVGDRAGEGTTLNGIGAVYSAQGRYEESLTIFLEALAIRREIGDRAGESTTLNNIGAIYHSLGRHNEALTQLEEALTIHREVGDRAGEGTTLNNIANVYQSQGRYEEALTTYEEALAIHREVGDRAGEGTTLNNIGFVYDTQEQSFEAITYYEQAIAVFESMRAISGNDTARAIFITQYAFLFHNILDLYMQENLLTEAFLVSEQGRARSFGDALATGSVHLSDNEAALDIAAELDSYNAVITAQDALAHARALNPPDPELVADLETQLEAAQTTHDNARALIEARSDQLTALIPGRRAVLSLSETQALLVEQTTLVSFWVLEERTIAFILTNDSIEVIVVDVTEETLNTQVKAFHDFAEIDSAHPDTTITLYNTLITPIHSYLNTPHLIIVPHQGLHYVPFAALTDGERYLMDDFAVTYLPNASMLQFLPDADKQPIYDTALILGNPTAGTADEFDTPLSNLPNAEQSAQTIANLFDTAPLVTDAATETAVRQNVSTANILHLGAHGRYNTVAPMQSAIYLTPGDDATDVENNGRLSVDEVYGLPMNNIELVVLSACETNLGYLDRDNPLSNISAGDELVSLNRAFLFQSPTVISTLWTVDDTATGLLMEQFYTNLLDGKSKADALRLAQLYIRDYGNGEYANPYYWAGFVLSGDGGEIEFSAASSTSPTPTSAPKELDTSVSEPTQILETTDSSQAKGTGICFGAMLPFAFAGLVINRKKKSYNSEK